MFKKMLLVASCATIFGVYGICDGMIAADGISYHLFSGSNHPSITPISPAIAEKLQVDLASCNTQFQSAGCAHLDEVAEKLIPELKAIYLGKDADKKAIDALETQEEEFFNDESKLPTAIYNITSMRHGLPISAYELALMYEQVGLESIALLWAKIAYNFGIKQAKQLGQQLLIKRGQ